MTDLRDRAATTADRAATTADRVAAVKAPPPRISTVTSWVVLGAVAVIGVFSFLQLDFTFRTVERTWGNIQGFFERASPFVWPGFSYDGATGVWGFDWAGVWGIGEAIAVTLGIVIIGTFFAAVLSIPVAYGAARNTTPNGAVMVLCRGIGIVTRAVPDLALAAFFVLAMTLGPMPGILAFAIHSVGMISKMMADAIEQIDEGPRLAIRSTGGSRAQEFWSGIVPQVLPAWVAVALHRADINLRGTVILGYVGVSGLGYELSLALGGGIAGFRRVIPIAIIILVLCILFEIVSSVIRARLLGVKPNGKGIGDLLVRSAANRSGAVARAIEKPGVDADPMERVRAAMHRPWTGERVATTISIWIAVGLLVLSFFAVQANWFDLFTAWGNLGFLADRGVWPPTFGIQNTWADVWEAIGVTLMVAFAATLMSTVFSVFIGSFAARNVAPSAGVRSVFRGILLVIRAMPELILAVVFIIITGLGAQAGTLALGIGGIGLLGKLIADSLEEVPDGPEKAIAAVGGSRVQIFFAATLPMSIPAFVAHVMYLLEQNIRAATLLGVVGGGGIGYLLYTSIRAAKYDQVIAYLLIIIAMVFVVEGIAMLIRRALK